MSDVSKVTTFPHIVGKSLIIVVLMLKKHVILQRKKKKTALGQSLKAK